MNNYWGADDWARFPDIYDNYKKWYALRNDTWEEEMATLEVRLKIFNMILILPMYIFTKKSKLKKINFSFLFQEADAETIKAGGRLSEDWPAAKKADGAPPFWYFFKTYSYFSNF